MPLVLSTLFAAAAAQATPPAVFVFSPEGERMVMERPVEPADDSDPPPPAWTGVKKGEAYRMVGLAGAGATVAASEDGGTLRPGCGGEELPTIPFDALPPFEGPVILVPGSWTAAPKVITPVTATDAALGALVAAALKESSLVKPTVTRGTAVKADLNGDGVDETVFSVTDMPEGSTTRRPGEYTLLGVAWEKDGQTTVVPLATQIVTAENVEYGDIAWEMPDLVAIADVDGDGAMEIVAIVWGYEVMEVNAWAIAADGTPRIVASASCAP